MERIILILAVLIIGHGFLKNTDIPMMSDQDIKEYRHQFDHLTYDDELSLLIWGNEIRIAFKSPAYEITIGHKDGTDIYIDNVLMYKISNGTVRDIIGEELGTIYYLDEDTYLIEFH